jgi:hypothetical protein
MVTVLFEHDDLNVCYSDQNEGNVHSPKFITVVAHHAYMMNL